MPPKLTTILLGIVIIGVGLFLIVYGIKGGLIEKRLLTNGWTKSYATGVEAVRRGWFYIVTGIVGIGLYLYAIIKTFRT